MGPVQFQDNTFRDGHQSIHATRMKTEDMIPIAERMDEAGFWAVEVWAVEVWPARGVGVIRSDII